MDYLRDFVTSLRSLFSWPLPTSNVTKRARETNEGNALECIVLDDEEFDDISPKKKRFRTTHRTLKDFNVAVESSATQTHIIVPTKWKYKPEPVKKIIGKDKENWLIINRSPLRQLSKNSGRVERFRAPRSGPLFRRNLPKSSVPFIDLTGSSKRTRSIFKMSNCSSPSGSTLSSGRNNKFLSLMEEPTSYDEYSALLGSIISEKTKNNIVCKTPTIVEKFDLTNEDEEDQEVITIPDDTQAVGPISSIRRQPINRKIDLTLDEDIRKPPVVVRKVKPVLSADHGVPLMKSVKYRNSFNDKIKGLHITEPKFVDSWSKQFENKRAEFNRTTEKFEKYCKDYRKLNHHKVQELLEKRLKDHLAISDVLWEEEVEVPPTLTPEMVVKVKDAWDKSSPPSQVLSSKFGLSIKRMDLLTLFGFNWLNDEVINFYMEMIAHRSTVVTHYPKVHGFSTFFYPRLSSSGYSGVRRWTKKVDIFGKDLILVPIHLQIHWCMATIDFRNKKIVFYDSMGSSNENVVQRLRDYVAQEHSDKKQAPYDMSDWKTIDNGKTPRQHNGSDCGVFACTVGEYLSRDSSLTFTQEMIPYFRQKMTYEILAGELL